MADLEKLLKQVLQNQVVILEQYLEDSLPDKDEVIAKINNSKLLLNSTFEPAYPQDYIHLFHVTFDTENTSFVYHPRVPESAGNSEDRETPRICLSDSIEHCMQAIAPALRDVRAGAKFIVKSVWMPKGTPGVISPKQLKESGRVPDALENNEYWYLNDLKFDQVYQCSIKSFDYEYELGWTCIPLEKCIEVIEKYPNPFASGYNLYDNSKSLYEALSKWSNETERFEIADKVWDDLANAVPVAQKTTIQNLVFQIEKVYLRES